MTSRVRIINQPCRMRLTSIEVRVSSEHGKWKFANMTEKAIMFSESQGLSQHLIIQGAYACEMCELSKVASK